MPIASILLLLAQLLPTLVNDIEAASSVLSTASTAVNNAKANNGLVSDADFAALDAQVNGDLSALAKAAGS